MATARSRKWLITINNPLEHGFDHARIKAAVFDLPSVVYWCMCDEQGDECETLHFVFGSILLFGLMRMILRVGS